MGASNTRRKKKGEAAIRFYRRFGRGQRQALPQVLHLWHPVTAAEEIQFRRMRREYLGYP